ncbi:hypothetical protein [Nocardiopsis ansamitocini]|uniref:Uncharacterized protein n=1 Tax=Nocardiopsis ansamitocini TaxID=1670832 RepID=A0A9W6P5A8_9ACTN|nr:hypothetical protein [Nocardiopsis ansamitocini]GLU47332.1 hypothetical protein Nans01_16830 [Nocardiopsis ansamitocini]
MDKVIVIVPAAIGALPLPLLPAVLKALVWIIAIVVVLVVGVKAWSRTDRSPR